MNRPLGNNHQNTAIHLAAQNGWDEVAGHLLRHSDTKSITLFGKLFFIKKNFNQKYLYIILSQIFEHFFHLIVNYLNMKFLFENKHISDICRLQNNF